MPLLDAALSFALTMLVVATVVTSILRVTVTAAKARRKQLLGLLRDYYREELEVTVRSELTRLRDRVQGAAATELADKSKRLADELARNPGLPRALGVSPEDARINEVEAHALVEVSTDEMIERIRRSELGQGLMAELKQDAEAIFDKLGERYEAVGARVSESFRSNARVWSSMTALVLALLLNIDSVHILSRYLADDEARARVLALYDTTLERYQQADQADAELDGQIDQVRQEIAHLQGAGFPVGWNLFPLCKEPGDDERCTADTGWTERILSLDTLYWLFGLQLTGVLAGLGAPFWWDLVTGIARATQTIRGGARTEAKDGA